METVRIGVSIHDHAYRNALLRGLSHESRDFQFIVLDGADKAAAQRTCQLIITDSEEYKGPPMLTCESVHEEEHGYLIKRGTEAETGLSPPVIRLTHHEMYDLGYRPDNMEIYRYEDARLFVNKIIYYYAREKGIDLYFHGKKKCRKVVFCSTRGGLGTTSAAVAAARFLKYRFDKKTLFISLCPVDGSRDYTGSGDGGNMLSLLYHLNTGEDVPLCKFISSQDGVDHIRGQRDNRAASEMTIREMKQLIRMIDEMGSYDYLFIDGGSHLSSQVRFMLERSDVNVVMLRNGDTDTDLMIQGSGSGRNMIKVISFDDGKSGDASVDLPITYDPNAFVSGEARTYIDIRGRYGKDIGALAEKIAGYAE